LVIDEELCACFIDWQKAFDRVNWTKLMEILKRTGIDWRERRLISKLYMEQSVKIQLDQGDTRSVKIGREVRQDCCLSPILFNLYSEYITKEAHGGFERCTRKIKSRTAIAKAAFNKKKTFSPANWT
jgi:hypothetical protein